MFGVALLTLLAWAPTLSAQETGPTSKTPEPPTTRTEELRKDAKRHFERGVTLLEQSKFQDALVDFLRSREAFPTRAATENAAICLRETGRTDAAYDMFRNVLLDFADLPPEVKERVERQVRSLDAQLARLTFATEDGTAVTVNGRPIGRTPFKEPVRVVAGMTVVRMYLDGYAVFETQLTTQRGAETKVEPAFQLLGSVGRLKVKEKSGAEATLLVDGVAVGKTPWEGALAPGPHAIWLEGGDSQGTAPKQAVVVLGQKSETTLELTALGSSLRVVATPPGATISLDGVVVGTGRFEANLPIGKYSLSASMPGFEPIVETVVLTTSARPARELVLRPIADREVSPFELGVIGAVSISPELDGVTCSDCERSLGVGGYVGIAASYRLRFGLGFDLEAGYLRNGSTLERSEPLKPVGLPANEAVFAEEFLLSGLTALGGVSYRPNLGRLPFLSVGARIGGFFGGARTVRKASGLDSEAAPFALGPYASESFLAGLVIKPELRFGISPLPWLDLWLSGAAMVLMPLAVEPWNYLELVPVGSNDGAARFREEELWGPQLHIQPGLGLGIEL
jgi:hypothetical protein